MFGANREIALVVLAGTENFSCVIQMPRVLSDLDSSTSELETARLDSRPKGIESD